jgi:hypothetical protein
MGQFALGIRSLLIKAAVFVALAALLAWVLGGTLFPRPSRAEVLALAANGYEWYWRVSVYGDRALEAAMPEEHIQWELLWKERNSAKLHVLEDRTWYEVAGPILRENRLYFGGRPADVASSRSQWMIACVDDQRKVVERWPMPDRLAVEQQLARLEAGFALQDVKAILAQRELVLDPPAKMVEESTPQ